jgi:hypothetical protein
VWVVQVSCFKNRDDKFVSFVLNETRIIRLWSIWRRQPQREKRSGSTKVWFSGSKSGEAFRGFVVPKVKSRDLAVLNLAD